MNQQAIADLSADLIIRYYDNDYMPFLNAMDDDALWYGPAQGQFLRGREAMIKTWQADEHLLRFTMGNLKVAHITANSTFCDVMLTYSVVTHYPDGHDTSVYQRLLMCWCERHETDENGETRKIPRILVCHISNPHYKHEDDLIYPKSSSKVYAGSDILPQRGERIHFHGLDRSDYFFFSDSIIWIEAHSGGKHSVLHTSTESVEVLKSVAEIEKQYVEFYLRCHQSYLVNPHYIRNIRRFQVTLTDGTVLPVPEKKFTSFKNRAISVFKH